MATFTLKDFKHGPRQNEISMPFEQIKRAEHLEELMALLENACPHTVYIDVTGKSSKSFRTQLKMQSWCAESTGDYWQLSGTIAKGQNEFIKFRFKSPEDATMFKLRWNDAKDSI